MRRGTLVPGIFANDPDEHGKEEQMVISPSESGERLGDRGDMRIPPQTAEPKQKKEKWPWRKSARVPKTYPMLRVAIANSQVLGATQTCAREAEPGSGTQPNVSGAGAEKLGSQICICGPIFRPGNGHRRSTELLLVVSKSWPSGDSRKRAARVPKI